MDFINEIIDLLHEEGIDVEYTGIDLDLREFLTDSTQFISFIVDVEKRFDIEMPDEYLSYDSISSLHSFAEGIREYKEENEANIKAHNGQ